MKVVIIDGQGGKLGQSIAEAIVKSDVDCSCHWHEQHCDLHHAEGRSDVRRDRGEPRHCCQS